MKFYWVIPCLCAILILPCCAGPEKQVVEQRSFRKNVGDDYRNFYSRRNLRNVAIGFGAAGIIANTNADQQVQTWYQKEVRDNDTDDASEMAELLGNGTLAIPLCVGAFVLGKVSDAESIRTVGEWGDRSVRAFLVGGPFVVASQMATGGSRPKENRGSDWRPLDDNNGVSGHAFVGAVPFLSAAKMTENEVLDAGLYLGSTLCAWSRLNDNKHFLSQSLLGWWLAYLAAGSVDRTEGEKDNVTLVPLAGQDMAGLGVMVSF